MFGSVALVELVDYFTRNMRSKIMNLIMILLGFASIVPLFVMDGLKESYWRWILMGEIVLAYTVKLVLWGLYDA